MYTNIFERGLPFALRHARYLSEPRGQRQFVMEPELKIEGIYLYMGPAPPMSSMESSGVVRASGQPQHAHR